ETVLNAGFEIAGFAAVAIESQNRVHGALTNGTAICAIREVAENLARAVLFRGHARGRAGEDAAAARRVAGTGSIHRTGEREATDGRARGPHVVQIVGAARRLCLHESGF